MQAEIITIGDELLMGLTVDTNSAWMGQELTALGFTIHRVTTISDNREEIIDALDASVNRSALVLVTGGLGPTSDDITKQTLADYFGSGLKRDEATYGKIEELLALRGLEMNENNRRQALVPDACRVLSNNKGTAPGMMFEKGGAIVVSMPGVPYEMKDIMHNEVIPILKQRFNKDIVLYRLIMVYGTFEAKLAEMLEPFESTLPAGVSLAYLPTSGIIKLRLTVKGSNRERAEKVLAGETDRLVGYIPGFVYGYDGITLEERVGELLKEYGRSLAIAESCTGGALSAMIVSVPGSSAYLRGSVVAYSNEIKSGQLGVENNLIIEHGAVSEKVAVAMAQGARKRLGADYGLSVTGVAGPEGGSDEKPVGTVWIGFSSEEKSFAARFSFGTMRQQNIRRASLAALNLLRINIGNFNAEGATGTPDGRKKSQ